MTRKLIALTALTSLCLLSLVATMGGAGALIAVASVGVGITLAGLKHMTPQTND